MLDVSTYRRLKLIYRHVFPHSYEYPFLSVLPVFRSSQLLLSRLLSIVLFVVFRVLSDKPMNL